MIDQELLHAWFLCIEAAIKISSAFLLFYWRNWQAVSKREVIQTLASFLIRMSKNTVALLEVDFGFIFFS